MAERMLTSSMMLSDLERLMSWPR